MSILRPAHSRQYSQLCRSVFQFICSILSVIALAGSASTTHAATLTVNAGGDLQAALNAAQPGDTITLAAGATFNGPFELPAKSGTAVITIRSATADASLPADGQRINPTYAQYLAKIRATTGGAAIKTGRGSGNWRLLFLEFLPSSPST